MSNEIVVRNYSDIKPFFEEKEKEGLINLNNRFIAEIDLSQSESVKGKVNKTNIATKVISGAGIANELSEIKKTHLEPILTPEMKEALSKGTARLCKSHKDGLIFPKIQYNNGKSEFLSLDEIHNLPNYTNVIVLMNQMQMQENFEISQNIITDFSEETNRQLKNIKTYLHDNRIIKAETTKQYLEQYLQDYDLYKKAILEHDLCDSYISMKKDIEANLNEIKQIVQKFNKEKTEEQMQKDIENEQTCIQFILEDINHLQVLYNIEKFLAYKSSEDDFKIDSLITIQQKYSDILIESFSQENLELLSGLFIGSKDIFREVFMPNIENLIENKEDLLLCQKNVKENSMEIV